MAAQSNTNQLFAPVQVTLGMVHDEEAKMGIHLLMSKLDDAKMAEANAHGEVVIAGARLLAARSARAMAEVEVVRAFAKHISQVAMEANWTPFRDNVGDPAVENFMPEHHIRNMQRMHRVQMNKTAGDLGTSYNGMFEKPDMEE